MKNVVERLLNLLAFLLTVARPVTAEEIRDTVAGYDQTSDEAFRRMFERDKDLLRRMGIPLELVYTDAWEVEQGYVVRRDEYELPDPGLTDEERAALWLAAQVVRLGGQPAGPEAILKLGGAPLAGAGEPLAADLGLAADELAASFLAVSERRVLTFEYRGTLRRVEPYGLLHRRGHWYVVGNVGGDRPDIRSFRVDRGSRYTATDPAGAFERPAGFSVRNAVPAAPWEAGEEDIRAMVTFDAAVGWWAGRQVPGDAIVDRAGDGSLTVRLDVANVDAFIGWILAFEEHAEVIGPAELRRRLVERIRGES